MNKSENKKKYITLYDRTWKGKEWFSSFRSQKFIRSLTEAEAAMLDGIEEVVPALPLEEGVVGLSNGRLYCKKCGSAKGFFVHKMHRGEQSRWYTTYKCADCGARERVLRGVAPAQ